MKHILFIIQFGLYFSINIHGQYPIELFKNALDTLEKIEKIQYDLARRSVNPFSSDTNSSWSNCLFQVSNKEPVIGANFIIESATDSLNNIIVKFYYDGNNLVRLNIPDSTAKVLNFIEDPGKRSIGLQLTPLNFSILELKKIIKELLENPEIECKIVGEERIGNRSCKKVIINLHNRYIDRGEILKSPDRVSNSNNLLWIDKKSYLPIKFSCDMYEKYQGMDLRKYVENTFSKIVINESLIDTIVPLDYIPNNFKIFTGLSLSKKTLLPMNRYTPTWALKTITDETIKLDDLKGKIIIMEFWFKGCGGCIMSIPMMKRIYNKYKSKNVILIGINPVDKNINDLKKYVEKFDINYPVLLDNDKEVANSYRVKAYPTIYLIDKNGKIKYATIGFTKETENEICKAIENIL